MNRPKIIFIALLASLLFGLTSPGSGSSFAPLNQVSTSTPVVPMAPTPPPSALPPQVISRSPAPGHEAELDAPIELRFDQPMQPAATEAAFQVLDPSGEPVRGSITWPETTLLRFTPSARWTPGASYEVTLAETAADRSGRTMTAPYTFRLNAVTPLAVTQIFPADGAQSIDVNTRITVMFNRPVVPLSVLEERGQLPQPLQISPAAPGQGEWISTSVYVFQPSAALRSSTEYRLTIAAGLNDATGTPGAALPQDYRWSFTTLAPGLLSFQIDQTTLAFSDTSNPIDVRLNPPLTITFAQPMDAAATQAAVRLVASNGEPAPLTFRWNAAGDVLTATPAARLGMGLRYTLSVASSARARDGAALTRGHSVSFDTVKSPAILLTTPSNGGTTSNAEFQVRFASPMNIKSVVEHIVFEPALEYPDGYWYNEYEHTIYYYGLKPSTQYTVTLQAGMLDLYGTPISEGRIVRFTTGPRSPAVQLMMPWQAMLRAEGPQQIFVSTTNIETASLSLYRLSPEQFVQALEGSTRLENFATQENLLWQRPFEPDAALDENKLTQVDLTAENGQRLPPGFYFLGLSSPQVPHAGNLFNDMRFFTVATSNLVFKSTVKDALLWVTDFETGQPVTGVDMKVVDNTFKQLGAGATDRDGLARLQLSAAAQEYSTRFAISTDEEILAFASGNWGSGVSPEDFGIWQQYYGPLTTHTAYIYTDRPLYRPGQPVFFKGIVRAEDDLAYTLPDQKEVEITIRSFDEVVYQDSLPLNDFGSFSGEFKLDQEAALGSYTLTARFPNAQTDLGYLSFTVAEYRRPEFMVDVTADPAEVLGGQRFKAAVTASYYSGGGVAEAPVTWTLRSAPFFFNPGGELSGFSFTDDERDVFYDSRMQDENDTVLAEGEAVTGPDGSVTLDLPADISKYAASRSLQLEVTVTDFSGFSVSDQAGLIAHRAQVYPGIRSAEYIGQAGRPQTFELVAVDWAAEPVPGQVVDVTVVERRWHSVQEQDDQGNITWQSSVEEIPVETFNAVRLDDEGRGSITFTPPNGGVFRARIIARDRAGNAASASAYMWVTGEGYIPWRQTNDRTFQLIANRDRYEVGDQAEIMIASPFQGEAYALITVERGRIRSEKVVRLTSNSTIYNLIVTPDMAPLVYVSVVIVKGVDQNYSTPDFRIGMARLNVSTDQQNLDVTVTPDKTSAGPGEQVTYTVLTRTTAGQPVPAEVSLGLSDLATLSLMPANTVPILDYFYPERSLSVQTAVSWVANQEEYNDVVREMMDLDGAAAAPEGQRAGSGGGKGSGELGVPEVRQDFPDTAFWKADLVTGEDGRATVAVTLPDNLTTWRMDARAVTLDTRAGSTTQDLVSSRPLLVRPQTPRFLVAGDKVTLGAAVHNNTGQDLSVLVSLDADGVIVDGQNSRRVDIQNGRQAYVTWTVDVPLTSQQAGLVFRARGGSFSDASRPTLGGLLDNALPVYRYDVPEAVGTAGELSTSGARTEVIRLPETMEVVQGELIVKIEPSLAAGMTAGLDYLQHYPYECTEQTVSRFLPNVLTTRAMQVAGLDDPELAANLKEQVNTGLQRLYRQQNADGGWGWWAAEKSHPLTSAYVVLGLLEARAADYPVDQSVLDDGVRYLQARVREYAGAARHTTSDRNRQAFVLYVLARAGQPDPSRVTALYDEWKLLDLYARGFLAQAMHEIDPADTRLDTILADLTSTAELSATGAHWSEAEDDRWNWGTDTRTTAILLHTLVRLDPENDLNPNIVRWLMVNRTKGHWKSTQETAWSLMALTAWMENSGELRADYDYTVLLNDDQIGRGSVDRENLRESSLLRVAVSDLVRGQGNALAFDRQGDAGSLYYTAHLNAYLPVSHVEALDQGFTLSRRYYPLDNLESPVTSARQGDLLLARLTLVVPHDTRYILVEDPLPAGLEAVDSSLQTSPSGSAPDSFDWENINQTGWGWWYFTHTELRDEKVVLSTDYLPAGTYIFTYMVRASTPGSFNVIPPTAQEFYFPEVYGRGDGSQFDIRP